MTSLPPPSSLPLGPGVRVVGTHPAGLVAVAKPSGPRSHPNDGRADPGALLVVPYDQDAECYAWTDPATGEARRLFLLHRLDAPTSGVILLAADARLAKAAREAFAGRAVTKTYVAAVFGPAGRAGTRWKDRLAIERRGGHVRAHAGSGGGTEAETSVRLLGGPAGPFAASLLSLRPLTGRTHQLRVQCAKRQLPIVGDATYGDFAKNRLVARALGTDRLFLHAAEIAIALTHAGRALSFSAKAPLPPEFTALRG